MYHGLAEKLAEFALSLDPASLPPLVLAEARRALIDAVTCAVAGMSEPSARASRAVASRVRGEVGATLVGGGRSSADWAAFANASHITCLEMDATYLGRDPIRPGALWGAIWAAGEQAGASGRDWLAAAVVGFEVAGRLADAAPMRSRGWDPATCLPIASALAVSRLLGLDHAQATQAVNLAGAGVAVPGLNAAGELSSWSSLAPAGAARAGLVAAWLAREGLTGPAPLFEGPTGLWQQVTGAFLLRHLGGTLTDDWILPRTAMRAYPASYLAQTGIVAAIDVYDELAGRPLNDVRAVEIATVREARDRLALDPERFHPRTPDTARQGLPFAVVSTLRDGTFSIASTRPDRLADPELSALLDRTTVVEDTELSADYPSCIPTRVRVTLDDGTTLESDSAYPPGHPRTPFDETRLKHRFETIAIPAIGPEAASEAWSRLGKVDDDAKPHEVLARLVPDRA
jgi:2-methylcitrate dehydratase